MSRLTAFLTLTLAFLSTLCAAKELPTDALIRGVNEAGGTIRSGEISAIVTIKRTAQKTEKEIEVWKQAHREKMLKRFKPHALFPDIGLKEYDEEYLRQQLESMANSYRERTDVRHVTTLFQILTDDPYLYQYKLTEQEVEPLPLDSKNAQQAQDSNFVLLAHDSRKQVKQTIGSALGAAAPRYSVEFFGPGMQHAGYWGFSAFGRSGIPVPSEAKNIGEEQVDGIPCYVLEFTQRGWTRNLWIEIADKNFSVRKVEIRKNPEDSVIISQIIYKHFKQFGEVWFPTIYEGINYGDDGTLRNQIRIETIAAQFNVKFPEDYFDIDRDFYYQPGPRRPPELQGFGRAPVTQGTEAEELLLLCGPQSLLRICEILSVRTNLSELKKLTGFNPNSGTTMLGLKRAATLKNLAPIGVKASLNLLKKKKVPLPALAYVDGNHFLVFEAVNKKGVEISDPAQKYNPHLTWDKLSEIWKGELLIFDEKKARKEKTKQGPLAFTETPEYDFGKALGGSEIKHTFTLKNIGQKPLKILSVTETCACTATVLSQHEIPTGGTGSISAVLTVPSRNEHVQESLMVLTNDPTQSTLTLTLKGQAFIPLTTFPERLTLGNQKPLQAPLTKRVSLHLQDDVEILSVRTDSEHLKATLETVNDIPYVMVKLLPTLSVGQFSHNLLVDYTYQGQQTTHNLIVFGQILGDLHVAPSRLFFGLIKEPETVSKTITISARDAQPFKITSVKSDTKGIVFKITMDESKARAQVTVSIAPTAKQGELSGDIVIHTSSTIQPTLRVPFFGILADAN